MAMRHPKAIVLSCALNTLFVMTIISTVLSRIIPNLISLKHTNSTATVKLLLLFPGCAVLYFNIFSRVGRPWPDSNSCCKTFHSVTKRADMVVSRGDMEVIGQRDKVAPLRVYQWRKKKQ
ncbi:hypothetical protein BUALT_Bualt06G0001200 [Buddleja alternifolia]|uniref:Uncharacterized protein n=1 Tax=Buddleja alternifolia TaxID=168488 RepID=A0AAV6XJD7_9LAMI|nr:hypothetical protein BUALT_Bualt06G0001200 [Buddleja alternifolia]